MKRYKVIISVMVARRRNLEERIENRNNYLIFFFAYNTYGIIETYLIKGGDNYEMGNYRNRSLYITINPRSIIF